MHLHIDVRKLVHALSDTLDLVGIDEVQHGKRVAFMACTCAVELGFDKSEIDKIYNAALLHDCGVSSTEVHKKLCSELDWEGSQEHCIRGEALLDRCTLFRQFSPVIRYHHTHWQDLPKGLKRQVAVFSNLIYMVDRVDALISQYKEKDILLARNDICDTIQKYRGSLFAPELVDCFLKTAENEFFWLTLDSRHLVRFLAQMEQDKMPVTADRKIILEVAGMFADIVDTKSAYTLAHSKGVSKIAKFLGKLVGLPDHILVMLEISGLLHDLGKLNVPDEILEKPGPLTEAERALMLRHSFESFQILRRITGFEDIAQWAAFHHEYLSGKGYPFRKNQEGLSIEARIIAVADVFQALAQKRPYRDSLSPEKIVSILRDMADSGKLDPDLVSLAENHTDQCWQKAGIS